MNYDKYTFFWDGPFSQWHLVSFEVQGVRYNCAEQYMMAGKARLFNDTISLMKIMQSKSPSEQKVLGRSVADFDPDIWEEHCKEIVYQGNMAKFSQNPALRTILENTKGTLLVEASPYDKIWGIGIGPDDPLRLDRANWKGKNYLGEVLTMVREDLLMGV